MSIVPLFRLAWRESRTARRRLLLYMSSISFGVAALVAIDSFSENVTGSVHDQSRALMGGDIAVTSRQPLPKSVDSTLAELTRRDGIAVARQTNFPSMIVNQRALTTRLVDIRAITPGYPLYGAIVSAPASAWDELHRGRNVIVDRGLLITLQAAVGDSVTLGSSTFAITGILQSVPGDVGIAAVVGPRVYLSAQHLAGTGLLGFGSRASYEAVLKLPPSLSPESFTRMFDARFRSAGVRLRTAGRNEERLSNTIDQLSDFLALVGLVALLLGGIGVASGVHAFVMRKIDTVAVLRCVGATSGQVLTIYVAQAAVMGFIGAAMGAVFGIAIQVALPRFLADFLPMDVKVSVIPSAVLLGLAIGIWVALVFALRPLVALRNISPMQTLRRDTDAEVMRRTRFDSAHMVVNLAIVGSLLALGLARAQTLPRGLAYSGAVAGAIGLLWIVAAGLTRAARRLARPGLPFPVRQGVAALYRPGNQTRSVVLALGFGVFLIGTLYQVQRNLLRSLNTRIDQSRANVVFFDVQESMLAGVDSTIRAGGLEIIERTPVIRMRIAAINSRSLRRDSTRMRGGWAARREYNSTYREAMTDAERLTAGEWFAATHAPGELPEVSLEQEVAEQLNLRLGDTVTWDVQGVEVPTRVTSFREVQWANFQTNFFVVFSPDALVDAPKQFVVLADAPDPSAIARLQGTLVARYPTVSSIDLTLVRKTILDVIGKVTTAIRFLAFLSLGLAIPVLFSAVSATRRQRLREGVLLKTLGATKRQIRSIMLSEYALLGGLGAVAGVGLSTAGAWGLMRFVFEQPFVPAILPMAIVAVAMMGISVVIGLLTGREVFAETPMAALRDA
ncbi:MAG TPA: FtsX-like permease family protein [Gemmatimonadaceae bacterium]|nr:FtsX-like permease family protein [Gemmatimonadaceae bacterium]